MSAMADPYTALEDQATGRPLDAEQAGLIEAYADYLWSPVDGTERRDAEMDSLDRWTDPDTNDGIEWADESD